MILMSNSSVESWEKFKNTSCLASRLLPLPSGNTPSVSTITVPTMTLQKHKAAKPCPQSDLYCHLEHVGYSRRGPARLGIYILSREFEQLLLLSTPTLFGRRSTWLEPDTPGMRLCCERSDLPLPCTTVAQITTRASVVPKSSAESEAVLASDKHKTVERCSEGNPYCHWHYARWRRAFCFMFTAGACLQRKEVPLLPDCGP